MLRPAPCRWRRKSLKYGSSVTQRPPCATTLALMLIRGVSCFLGTVGTAQEASSCSGRSMPPPALTRGGELSAGVRFEKASGPSGHSPNDLADLLHDLADLVFADDQRRRQRQRVAGDPQHQVVVVEGVRHGVVTALADQVGRSRCKVDARGQADGADVEHVGLAL